MSARAEPEERRRGARILLVALGIAAVAAAALLLPLDDWLVWTAEWVRAAGAPGIALYVVLYVVATVLLLPGSALTLVAGFAWGPILGSVIVLPTATMASLLAFLVGRFVARDWVERKIRRRPRFAAVDRAVKNRSFRVVLLLRLSPVFPYNFLNYALGLTGVPLGRYALASFIGMLPGTVLYVYVGSLVTNASRLVRGATQPGSAQAAFYMVGLIATVAVAWLLAHYARLELQKELADA